MGAVGAILFGSTVVNKLSSQGYSSTTTAPTSNIKPDDEW